MAVNGAVFVGNISSKVDFMFCSKTTFQKLKKTKEFKKINSLVPIVKVSWLLKCIKY